jgi:hypothetical protein
MQLTQSVSTHTNQRIYLDEFNHKYVSISRLANFFQSTIGLYRWNLKHGRKIAAEQGLEGLTDRQLYELGKPEGDRICEESAQLGTAVHLSIETGKLTGNPEYDAYVEQYHRHIAPHLEILYQEIVLGHVTPEGLRFAGTCDLIGKWKDELVIGDWKTSEKIKNLKFMGKYALQLAAYSLSFEQSHETQTDTGIIFNLLPDAAHIFRIPLQPAKEMLLSTILPEFYSYYRQPEPRCFPNQWAGMGDKLQRWEKELSKLIEVE